MNILVIFFIRVMAVKKPFFFHTEIMTLCFWQVMWKGKMYQVGLTGKYVTKCTEVCLLILDKFLVHLGKSLRIL